MKDRILVLDFGDYGEVLVGRNAADLMAEVDRCEMLLREQSAKCFESAIKVICAEQPKPIDIPVMDFRKRTWRDTIPFDQTIRRRKRR